MLHSMQGVRAVRFSTITGPARVSTIVKMSRRSRTQARIRAWRRLALWLGATSMAVLGAALLVIMLIDLKGSISTDWLGLTSYRGHHGQPLGVVYSLATGLAMSFVGVVLLRRLFKSNQRGSGNDDQPS